MLYASVLNARSLQRHGVMMRADPPVGKSGMKPPDNILVRILGARGRCAEGDGEFRIEPDRLSVIGDGAGELTLVEVRETAVVVGEGELGIEPNRLVEVGDGAVELMLAAVREATVVAGIAPFFASSL